MDLFCSEVVNDLAGAMLKVQAEINPAIKDRENPFAKAKYATLNSVMEASREVLLKHGVWLVQYAVPVEAGHVGLVTKLVHAASGQWQASFMVMPLPKADPQGFGSALTYARRYSLATLVGLVVEDDDGEAACGRSRKNLRKNSQNKHTEAADLNSSSDCDSEIAAPSSSESDVLKKLPKFDGVNYQLVNAADGKLCVVATGQTSGKKELLRNNGFRWNPERKIWWKYAQAA
ncbi:single-stranded DNA-binding protein [Deltaproteobacteria bacterium Smac51]|nr:single-stranded DNA-binding protein [Deltaproteobacteria bacterium Smac51]